MKEPALSHIPDKEGTSRIRRRLLTVPAMLLISGLSLVLMPLLCTLSLAVDFVRDPMKMPWTRTILAFNWFVSVEALCLILAMAQWLGERAVPAWRGEASVRANSWIQRVWGRVELHGILKIFSMKLAVEGRECLEAPGPLIYLVRHVSMIDTTLPIVFGHPRSRVFRYVLKAELLMDPLLDMVGQRLPNYFVRRGSSAPEAEIRAVVELADNMAPHEAYVMYPEGTRFTSKRRERILATLAQRDPEAAHYAAQLQETLPPTRRGPVSLLNTQRDVDIIILSHRGLEGTSHMPSMLQGLLVGKTLALRFERFAAGSVPPGEEGARAWLRERWLEVDAFAADKSRT